MFGGGGVGPPMGGGGAPGSAQAGLPFGGIPHELQAGVDLLLEEEPERGQPDVVFTQLPTEHESKKLTLTSLLMEYPGMCVLAGFLVGMIALPVLFFGLRGTFSLPAASIARWAQGIAGYAERIVGQ